jgi:hypothetical protein
MIHFASPSFWSAYEKLPVEIKKVADKNFDLLKLNPKHPSLHFKKIKSYWAVRVGIHYRALAVEVGNDILWFWIGSHTEYDALIKK